MAERTDQRTRDRDVSVDVDTDFGSVLGDDSEKAPQQRASEQSKSGGLRSRVSERVGDIFSVQTFAVTLFLTVALAFIAGTFVPIIPGSSLFGVFAGGFLVGAGGEKRRYLEVGAATLMSGALTALLSNLFGVFLGFGVPLVAMGAGASGLAGILGHYFGRDLRAGLTQDI